MGSRCLVLNLAYTMFSASYDTRAADVAYSSELEICRTLMQK